MADQQVPVPDDALADFDDEAQVALIAATPNGLTDADLELPQPPQDGTYVPEGE